MTTTVDAGRPGPSWTVRVGEDLYVRSAYGTGNPWFRRATATGSGRIRAASLERDRTGADTLPETTSMSHSCRSSSIDVPSMLFGRVRGGLPD
jgi:Uncharacterized protein conserved in bacteria (DUF2255)